MSKAEMELREKVKKRGRAYQCLACYQRLGRVYINEKLKVEDHIYRDHVRADEIPFYCRLCRFHCQRLDQLLNHVRNYTPHVEQVRRRGLTDGGKSFLTKSTKPYVISALDCKTGGRGQYPTLDESGKRKPRGQDRRRCITYDVPEDASHGDDQTCCQPNLCDAQSGEFAGYHHTTGQRFHDVPVEPNDDGASHTDDTTGPELQRATVWYA